MKAKPAILFFCLCAAWYCYETIVTVIPGMGQPSDFIQYYDAARNILSGLSPFATKGYIYPPLLAFLLTPIAALSYVEARWIWFLFSQACLLTAAWLLWRAIGRDSIAACSIAFVWALGGAAPESFGLGQPGPVLVLLIAIAITQPGSRAAIALGTGVAIKLFPGVWAIVFLLRRQWRAFLTFTAASLLLLLLPWSIVSCCLSGPKTPAGTDTWTGTPAVLSWGVPSVVLRILDPPTQGALLPRDWESGNDLPDLQLPSSRRWISMGVAAATLLAGIAALALAFKDGLSPVQAPFAMAALVSLSLAASPVCWTHYQLLQYPGVALLLCRLWRSRLWSLLASTLALSALLYPLPVAVLGAYYARYGKWTATSPTTLYLWTSVAAFACLALFGLFVREAGRQRV